MGAMNLFSVATIAALMPSALGHGWMAKPAARQLPECNDRSITSQFGPAAGTGGGINGETLGGTPGLCGDPFLNRNRDGRVESTFVDLPCQKERDVFTEGGTLDMEWHLTANHGGFFECKICDDPNNLSQECFDKWPLLTVEHNNPRWYIMTDESSRVHDPENADKPRGHTFSWSWHLPVGLTCEHCVVQCTWPSHTHCTFPCEREVCGWYADQYNHIMRPERQSNYKFKTPFCEAGLNPAPGQAPQIFRNCGDITIVPSGDGGTSPVTQPAPVEISTPAPAPVPEPETDTPTEVPAETPDDVVESNPEVISTPPATTTPVATPPTTEEFVEEPSPMAAFLARYTPQPSEPSPSPGAEEAGAEGNCGADGQPPCTGREFECNEGSMAEGGICVPRTPEEEAVNEEVMREEEEREVEELSPAGNMLACSDSMVSSVIRQINKRRGYNGKGDVTCSERATGTAEEWSTEMCANGGTASDRENNCNLAGFTAECSEMVAKTGAKIPLKSLASEDMKSLRMSEFTSVGVGYADCGDGEKAWTLLFN